MATYICWLLLLSCLCRQFIRVLTLKMISENQSVIVEEGKTIILECSFHADSFNLFDYPIVWRKRQHTEEVQVNMMGNLVEPFLSARRFRATFTTQSPSYVFRLTVMDVIPEDNGEYSCEIGGPQNAIVAMVTHNLIVKAPVDVLVITDRNSTDFALDSQQPSPLTYTERVPGALGCVALGGFPPPELDVYVSQKRLKAGFRSTQMVSYSGQRGMRRMYYTTFRWSVSFQAVANDDGEDARCVASVLDQQTNVTVVKLSVNFSPIIECDPGLAFLEEKNAFLSCRVRSKPSLISLYWIIDNNGTKIEDGKNTNEYWTITMDRLEMEGLVETQLFIRQARRDSFRVYTLTAENGFGMKKQDVMLTQKFHDSLNENSKSKRMQSKKKEPSSDYLQNSAASSSSICCISSCISNQLLNRCLTTPSLILSHCWIVVVVLSCQQAFLFLKLS